MSKRFMITAAGAAATGIAGLGSSAFAEIVNFTHGLDRWAGEHSWQMYSSGGSLVASMYVSGGLYYAGSLNSLSFTSDSASSHFGDVTFNMDLAAGDYTIMMQDAYGDGWSWYSYTGGIWVSGAASGYGTVTGSSASMTFTVSVIPAPSALALLGLAGLAARRRK